MGRKILIDCSLTGGRGPAKKTVEFIWECKSRKIEYYLISDQKLAEILMDFNIVPDVVVNTNYRECNEKIYESFEAELKKLTFSFLIKFGARTVGPYIARKQGIPYVIIDGGLPDKYEAYPSLYDKETYINAKKYIVTTNFPWIPSFPTFLKNVEVCYYPISGRTYDYLLKLRKKTKKEIFNSLKKLLSPFPKFYDLIINLNMTDDYVDEKNRDTYGAWLKSRSYDQVVGFIRRLISDLGFLMRNKKVVFISDKKISQIGLDLYKRYPNIYPVTWKEKWSYYGEISLDAISDVTVARAANYQPYLFALARGNSITTAVPADGYMDEDTAAYQAGGQKLTYNLLYDDPQYGEKLLNFYRNKTLRDEISLNQMKNFAAFGQRSNTIDRIFRLLKI